MLKNPKGSPLSVFRHCETFFRKFVFSPKGPSPLQLQQKCCQFRKCPPFSAPGGRPSGPRRATRFMFFAFLIFEFCKLTLGSPFAIFEPWIWRRLGPVPACSSIFLFNHVRMQFLSSIFVQDDSSHYDHF